MLKFLQMTLATVSQNATPDLHYKVTNQISEQKHLLSMHDDLSSNPQHSRKIPSKAVYAYNLSIGRQNQKIHGQPAPSPKLCTSDSVRNPIKTTWQTGTHRENTRQYSTLASTEAQKHRSIGLHKSMPTHILLYISHAQRKEIQSFDWFAFLAMFP